MKVMTSQQTGPSRGRPREANLKSWLSSNHEANRPAGLWGAAYGEQNVTSG
jgi:hypothetical protein